MGMLEDIIRTVQEAVEEAQGGRPRRPTGRPLPMDAVEPVAPVEVVQDPRQAPVDYTRDRLARLAAERKQVEARQRLAEAERGQRERQVTLMMRGTTQQRVLSLLRDPRSARDAIVLAEVLGKPVALRPRR